MKTKYSVREEELKMSDKPTYITRSRELRQNMTEAEKRLWAVLRNRKFQGLKFLRQHPVVYQVQGDGSYYFVADFYCAEKKFVIEVDGKIHDFQKEDDSWREDVLKSLGLYILRIRNEETGNMSVLMDKIKSEIERL